MRLPRVLFLPVAALAVLAGYLGWQAGQPVSETDIINRYAAIYVRDAGAGAQVTDCVAVPDPRAAVRMVISCVHPGGDVIRFAVGPRGALIPEADQPEA